MFFSLIFLICSNWISKVSSEHLCSAISGQATLNLQAVTADTANLYLIESNYLTVIPWTDFKPETDQLKIDCTCEPITWDQVDLITKGLAKFRLFQQSPKLLQFQMLPSPDNTNNSPLMHLVVSDGPNGSIQEHYWHVKDSSTTFYYQPEPNGDIPQHYSQISDGTGNRSYVFTSSSELAKKKGSKNRKNPVTVLLPVRDRQADYWFWLKSNQDQTKVSFELQGDPELVPLSKQHKPVNVLLKNDQLPLGFIRGSKVYLFQDQSIYIFTYLEVSKAHQVLDFTKPAFPVEVQLQVKSLKQFFICPEEKYSGTAGTLLPQQRPLNCTQNHAPDDALTVVAILLMIVLYIVGVVGVSYICYRKKKKRMTPEVAQISSTGNESTQEKSTTGTTDTTSNV